MPVDVARLRGEKLYEVNAPLDQVGGDLFELADISASWRAARKRLQLVASIAIVLGFVGLAVQPLVGLVLIAAAIFLYYRAKSYPKQVAKDDRYCPFARQVVGMLAVDAHPKAPVSIRIAFDPAREILSQGPMRYRPNGKEESSKSSWFSVETTLLDGTTFTETVDDFVRERKFTNTRGKQKRKTRTRSLIGLKLAYPSEVYGDLTPLAAKLASEIRLSQYGGLRGAEASDKAVKAKALVTDLSQLGPVQSILALGAYRVLNFAREAKARKGAAQ